MAGWGYLAAIPAASWPHLLAPRWEGRSCPLPPPHTPATCPVPRANREKAASQRGRAHNFAASGRSGASVQGSSYRRPELGEFASLPLCGGAAAAARGAASRASGGRWPRSGRPPALPESPGLRLCRPPPGASPAPVLNGQLPESPGRLGGLGRPCSRGARAAAARRTPLAPPAPVLRLPGAAAHLEAAPAPPWRPAWGRHLLHRSLGRGLPPGWAAPRRRPGALGQRQRRVPRGHTRACLELGPRGGGGRRPRAPGALAPAEGTPR